VIRRLFEAGSGTVIFIIAQGKGLPRGLHYKGMLKAMWVKSVQAVQ